MSEQDAPDWAIKHFQDARQLLGLGGVDWHFFIKMTESPGGEDKTIDGMCRPDAVYQIANIEIIDSLQDDERGKDVIYHETLHVAHCEVDSAADMIFDWLPKQQRRLAQKLYREAVERYTTRIGRALCASITRNVDDDWRI